MYYLTKFLEFIKTIKLTGGTFGKTYVFLIVLCICVTSIVNWLGSLWLAGLGVMAVSANVFYAIKRAFDFADKNPQAAIMEGAELLDHERLVYASKSAGPHQPINLTTEHDVPSLPDTQVFIEDARPTDENSSQTNSAGDNS